MNISMKKRDSVTGKIQAVSYTHLDVYKRQRYIRYSNVEEDEELQAYVKQLEEDPELKALYADMQSRYQEALENDEALRTFMEKVTTGSGSDEAEAGEEQTEEAAAEETTEEQPEETQEESVETGEAQAQNRETRVKESVNVRSDATTDSDRIALAYHCLLYTSRCV